MIGQTQDPKKLRKVFFTLIAFLILSASACIPSDETTVETGLSTASPTFLVASPTRTENPPRENPTAIQTDVPTRTPLPTIELNSLQPGQHAYSFRASSGEDVRFLLFLPDEYDPAIQWPLIVFFHGFGGNGLNIARLVDQTLPELLETAEGFPFIVVSPHLPSGFWPKYIDPVDELLSHLGENLAVDTNRLYLTGFSIGGQGAWRYALRYPDRFAAVAPIAGGASVSGSEPVPDDICKLSDLPIWVFHSEADVTVPVELNKAVVDELQSCGADIEFTLYSDLGHLETVLDVYGKPDLFDWFLQHSK